jgi:hypothetical protein
MPSITGLKAKEEMLRIFDSMPKSSTTTVSSPQELDELTTTIEEINLIEGAIWRNNPKINIAQTQDSAINAITMAQKSEKYIDVNCIINTTTTAQESNETVDISCI